MNEELLKALWEREGFKAKGVEYDNFATMVQSSEEMRRALHERAGFSARGVAYDTFESTLGIGSQSDVQSTAIGEPEAVGQEEESYFGWTEEWKDTPVLGAMTDFIDDVGRAVGSGLARGATTDEALSLMYNGPEVDDEMLDRFLQVSKDAEKYGQSDEMRNFNKIYDESDNKFLGFLKGLAYNPTVAVELPVTSLSQLLNKASLMGGVATASVGVAAGGIGAVPAFIAGAAGTMEVGASFSEFLREEVEEKGLEFDQEGVRKVLEDPQALSRIRTKAAARGLVIGVIDAFTGKLATSVGAKALRSGTRAGAVKGATKGLGIEAIGGGVGESAARAVVGQEQDVREIGFEVVGEIGPGSINVASTIMNPPSYEINGEKRSRSDVIEILNSMTPQQIAEGDLNITVNNDPELKKLINKKYREVEYLAAANYDETEARLNMEIDDLRNKKGRSNELKAKQKEEELKQYLESKTSSNEQTNEQSQETKKDDTKADEKASEESQSRETREAPSVRVDAEVRVEEEGITLNDIWELSGTEQFPGDIPIRTDQGEGFIRVDDGGKVTIEVGNTIEEINDEESFDKPVTEISNQFTNIRSPRAIDVKGNFRYTIEGQEYSNGYSDPTQAINYDENGNVVSVDLNKKRERRGYGNVPDNNTIETVTFEGQTAEDLAYQILLESQVNNNEENIKDFREFLGQEVPESTTEGTDTTVEEVQETEESVQEQVEPISEPPPRPSGFMADFLANKTEEEIDALIENAEQSGDTNTNIYPLLKDEKARRQYERQQNEDSIEVEETKAPTAPETPAETETTVTETETDVEETTPADVNEDVETDVSEDVEPIEKPTEPVRTTVKNKQGQDVTVEYDPETDAWYRVKSNGERGKSKLGRDTEEKAWDNYREGVIPTPPVIPEDSSNQDVNEDEDVQVDETPEVNEEGAQEVNQNEPTDEEYDALIRKIAEDPTAELTERENFLYELDSERVDNGVAELDVNEEPTNQDINEEEVGEQGDVNEDEDIDVNEEEEGAPTDTTPQEGTTETEDVSPAESETIEDSPIVTLENGNRYQKSGGKWYKVRKNDERYKRPLTLQKGDLVNKIEAELSNVQEDNTKSSSEAIKPSNSPVSEHGVRHAESLGGIAYDLDNELGLVQGFNLTGRPVYSAYRGGSRTRVDIDKYTGDLFTQEEISKLRELKKYLESLENTNEQNSENPFKKQGRVASTDSVPKRVKQFVEKLTDLLGIKENIFIITDGDFTQTQYKKHGLYGSLAPVRSAAISSANKYEFGGKRYMSDADAFYIYYDGSLSAKQVFTIVSHEVGHIIEQKLFRNAPTEVKSKIKEEYQKWYANLTGKTVSDVVNETRDITIQDLYENNPNKFNSSKSKYISSFSEYFADNVSKWARTSEKPKNIVDKFFSDLVAEFEKIYNYVFDTGNYSKSIFEWLDSQYDTTLGESNLIVPVSTIIEEEGMRMQRFPGSNFFKEDPSNLFSPSKIRESVRDVNVDRIIPTEKFSEGKVGEMGTYKIPEYNENSSNQPIAIKINDEIYLLDGHHRLELAKRSGEKTIKVAVKDVTEKYSKSPSVSPTSNIDNINSLLEKYNLPNIEDVEQVVREASKKNEAFISSVGERTATKILNDSTVKNLVSKINKWSNVDVSNVTSSRMLTNNMNKLRDHLSDTYLNDNVNLTIDAVNSAKIMEVVNNSMDANEGIQSVTTAYNAKTNCK